MTVELYHGDCLDIMPTLPDHSFDAIIADLPYGTTACKWDTVIPFEPLWEQYKRLIKKCGAIVLFGSQPFTSALVMSNVKWFKYCWFWKKERGTGFASTKYRPMNIIQEIAIFYKEQCTYNPQMVELDKPYRHALPVVMSDSELSSKMASMKSETRIYKTYTHAHPTTMLEFPRQTKKSVHPTQKPVAMLEHLIKTYTNEGDTVLDNTMGSGTTMVACVHTRRNGVGIEMLPVKESDPDYFGIAQGRVEKAQNELIQLGFLEATENDRITA